MSQYFASLFRRRPNEGWFRVSRFDLTTVDIMSALAIASMFVWAASPRAFSYLIFSAPRVRSGEVWRLATWPIAEEPGFFALISIAFFWSFGQQLEGLFGRGRFVVWILSVALLPSIGLTVLGAFSNSLDLTSFSFGLGPIFLAGIWVYAATYPNVRWFEIVPLWAIAAIFTMLQLLNFTGSRASGGILFMLLSIATALSIGRSLGFATAWPIPHVPVPAPGSNGGRSRRSKPSKPKRRKRGGTGQRVVEGPWSKSTSGSMPAPPSSAPTGPSPADQAELDGLLDKIGSLGMESLSTAEKQRLNELSKRLRNS
ncbi:MAG: hypothetical protein ACI8V4_001923 [Ilumatobacter sp.]|jgi:hypothetical protein